MEATDLDLFCLFGDPVGTCAHNGVLDVQPALVVVQGVQPEHRVDLTLLLHLAVVLLAPVDHVPARLPGVGGHLDNQVLLPLAGGTVDIGLIQVKEEGWTGFSKGWQGCSEGNPSEQPCQPFFQTLLLRFKLYFK